MSETATFSGVSGETLTAGHDQGGVRVATPPGGAVLTALTARALAAYLTGQAVLAEAWVAGRLHETAEPGDAACGQAGED